MADRPRTRVSLVPDCGSCFGLCCVALPFAASADFPVDKPAGQPCGNLRERLPAAASTPGCARPAGRAAPSSTASAPASRSRRSPSAGCPGATRPGRPARCTPCCRSCGSCTRCSPTWGRRSRSRRPRRRGRSWPLCCTRSRTLTAATAEALLRPRPGRAARRGSGPLLQRTSAVVRADARRARRAPASLPRRVRPGADLLGADLRGADLRAADLRGAYLIAADLCGADLRTADLLGADLRDADLPDADLAGALFLTQPQLNAARGNAGTRIPARPATPGPLDLTRAPRQQSHAQAGDVREADAAGRPAVWAAAPAPVQSVRRGQMPHCPGAETVLTDMEGVRCLPEEHRGVGALVLAGSSGRVDTDRARVLGAHGVLAESIRWFGGDGQHDGPWEIPVELFLDRVAMLRKVCERVIVLGTSFGAEAALVTGVLSDHVDAVVAFAPSDECGRASPQTVESPRTGPTRGSRCRSSSSPTTGSRPITRRRTSTYTVAPERDSATRWPRPRSLSTHPRGGPGGRGR